jgi:hypothetical protein
MSIPALLIQVAISLLVVTLYHLWVSRKKPSAPPVSEPPAASAPALAAPVAAPPKTLPVPEPVPPQILAVIAAAITVVLDRPYRVVSVQQAAAPTGAPNIWAMEGRVEQFMSHRVR